MRHASTLLLAVCLLGSACGGNTPPQLDPITDQMAFVNREFTLSLHASDEDGDDLEFGFGADIPGIANRASIEPSDDGRALFRWTPISSDRAPSPIHSFDFIVSDGEASHSLTVGITVGLPGEGSTSPVFVQPLGTGTTLDLLQKPCLDLPVEIDDPDSAEVTLGQSEPTIDGAWLEQTGHLTGIWHWCPDAAQVAQDDRYVLTLSAADADNPATLKNYLVVLRSGTKADCPGDGPVVVHDAQNISSVVDLTVTAQVSDDLGIKYEPLFYYATTAPPSPPDVAQMTQLTMVLLDGDMRDGTWGAEVPNPIANQPSGSTAQLYYLIVAQDNDDAEGTCDHLTESPPEGVHQITVTNPGGSGNLQTCQRCSADVQCGGATDHCIYLADAYYCLATCEDTSECDTDYYCSFADFISIDGSSARRCVPNSYECASHSQCVDDSFEENDTMAAANAAASLGSQNYTNLKICPGFPSGDDEDWYRVVAADSTRIVATMVGGSASDLDLELRTSTGSLVMRSDGLESNETIDSCVEAGTYFLHVFAWGEVENQYSLNVSLSSSSCSSCQDDPSEQDDNAAQARLVDLNAGPYESSGNAICAADDDWYEVEMFASETLYAKLWFTQSTGTEDLDVYIYRDNVNLTGCSEATPATCNPTNGASGTSDESLVWPINQTATYYVVVHGWGGSQNDYDICIGIDPDDCP